MTPWGSPYEMGSFMGTISQSSVAGLQRAKKKKWKTTRLALLLLLPSLIFLALFTFYPIGYSVYMSFFKNNQATYLTGPVFIGWDNYVRLFTKDAIFTQSFWNNIIIAVATVPTSIALAIMMALFANKVKFGKGLVRVSFFYPTLLPMVAVANIWLFIYTPMYGLLGYINPNWRFLTDPNTVLWALIVMMIWKQAGYVMVFFISGLQNINPELYEAGAIDGIRNRWQELWYITMPSMSNILLFSAVMQIQSAFSVSTIATTLTGFPSVNYSTHTIVTHLSDVSGTRFEMGYAAALSVFLFALMAVTRVVIGKLIDSTGK